MFFEQVPVMPYFGLECSYTARQMNWSLNERNSRVMTYSNGEQLLATRVDREAYMKWDDKVRYLAGIIAGTDVI